MQKSLYIKLRHKLWTRKIRFQHIKQQICLFPLYTDGESLQISIKKITDYSTKMNMKRYLQAIDKGGDLKDQ